MTSRLPFDLCHPDGLLFDVEPHLFVDTARNPVVFSVRGIRYFAPRFRWIGIDISSIETGSAESALRSWLSVEFTLLRERISNRAQPGDPGNPYNAMLAIMCGDLVAAQRHLAALERPPSQVPRLGPGPAGEDAPE